MTETQPASIPQVAVLLTAYNGMAWIEEQVDTILNQEKVAVTLFISVDLSSDGTHDWCLQRAASDNRMKVLPYGETFGGAATNFFRLIHDVDFTPFDYIALSDQDDLWFPDKLHHSASLIQTHHYDAVSSDVIAFWADGREKRIRKSWPQKRYDHFFEAAGPGCTYLFKADALSAFQSDLRAHRDTINRVALHDWFLYAWFRQHAYLWHIDDTPMMHYRQHTQNQVGVNCGLRAWKNRLGLVKNKWYRGEVEKIRQILHYPEPFGFWFRVKQFRQLRRRPRDAWVLLALTLFGLY
jgi:rhamnosyltransferase